MFRETPRKSSLVFCIVALFFLDSSLSAQTTQPGSKSRIKTHVEFLRLANEYPLAPRFLVSVEGKPLTEEQKLKILKSDQLLAEAETFRQAGDYAAARDRAEEAMQICRGVLGPAHYLSISATGARRLYGACADQPENLQKLIKQSDEEATEARRAYANGKYLDAERSAKSSIDKKERVFGTQFNELVDSDTISLLGLIQTQAKKYKEAEENLDRAIKVIERSYGKSHPRMAIALGRKGWLLLSTSKPEQSLEILRQAASIMNNTVGESLDTARVLDYLGTACALNGDYEGAIYRKVRSLIIREKIAGPDSIETGEALSNLAWLYNFINLQDECEPLRKRALAIFTKQLNPDHPYLLIELGNVALTADAHGHYDEAIQIFEKYMDKRKETSTLNELHWPASLGYVYLHAGRVDDARRVFNLILEDVKTARSTAEGVAAAQNLSAAINSMLGHRMYDDAETFLESANKILPESGRIIVNPGDLIQLYEAVGKNDEVLRITDAEITKLQSQENYSWQDYLGLLSTRAKALRDSGKLDQAEGECQKMLQIVEKADPPDPLSHTACSVLLGRVHLKQNKLQDAQFDFQESSKTLEQLKDTKSLIYYDYLLAVSDFQIQQKQYEEARKSLDKCLELADKVVKQNPAPLNKGLLLDVLKQYHDLFKVHPAADSDAIESRLKSLYQELKQNRQLNAKSKAWASELGA